MCILITKEKGARIPVSHLRNSYESNPDGCGIAFPLDGKVEILKDLYSFKDFLKLYRSFEDRPMLIHFRIRTHGSISQENCHPFPISKNLAMGHNGVISIDTLGEESDTVSFIRNIAKPILRGKNTLTPEIAWLFSKSIGYSKLAFIDSSGHITRINEKLGKFEQGGKVWYSNTSYTWEWDFKAPVKKPEKKPYWLESEIDEKTYYGFVDSWKP